ncbi:MAG: L-seryl-tRNA(Sec) selenium transferase, partial [Anaerolineae bacterium]
ERIPVWRMIAAPLTTIERRAQLWQGALQEVGISTQVVDGRSTVGGGSLPGETLPTKLLALSAAHPDRVAAALRNADPPVIGRIETDRLVLDPRTVLPEEEEALLDSVVVAVSDS